MLNPPESKVIPLPTKAIVGAFLVNGAKTFFTAFAPEYWLFILGGLFVLVTLYMPNGVVGLLKNKLHLGGRRD